MNKKERDAAIRELDQVEAQIERSNAKRNSLCDRANRSQRKAQSAADKVIDKAVDDNDREVAPLQRRADYLRAEIKTLV